MASVLPGGGTAVDETAEFRVPAGWRVPEPRRSPEGRPPRPGPDGLRGRPGPPAGRRPIRVRKRSAYAPVPLPPTDGEKFIYRQRRLGTMMLASFVSFGCLLASQLTLLRTTPWMLAFAPVLVFTLFYYLISIYVNIFTRGFHVKKHRQVVARWQPEHHPSVDIFLPVCGEPPTCCATRGPTCADGGPLPGPGARPRAGRLGRRRDVPDGAGASASSTSAGPTAGGSRRRATCGTRIERTDGDFILVLDADFTPRLDMLDEMLPYFDPEPDLGIVQSPQFFRVHKRSGLAGARRRRRTGAVLPLGAGVPAAARRGDLRGQLRASTGGRRWTPSAARP